MQNVRFWGAVVLLRAGTSTAVARRGQARARGAIGHPPPMAMMRASLGRADHQPKKPVAAATGKAYLTPVPMNEYRALKRAVRQERDRLRGAGQPTRHLDQVMGHFKRATHNSVKLGVSRAAIPALFALSVAAMAAGPYGYGSEELSFAAGWVGLGAMWLPLGPANNARHRRDVQRALAVSTAGQAGIRPSGRLQAWAQEALRHEAGYQAVNVGVPPRRLMEIADGLR